MKIHWCINPAEIKKSIKGGIFKKLNSVFFGKPRNNMSYLKKLENFVKFLVNVKTKKQTQALLQNLTPAQNLAIREIIYNVSRRYPNHYKRLAKNVSKPLSIHFLKKYWEQLWKFLQEHSAFF